jgi:hypothetical protein
MRLEDRYFLLVFFFAAAFLAEGDAALGFGAFFVAGATGAGLAAGSSVGTG